MKKTLIAVAALSAMAASAMAADVTLYGTVDYGYTLLNTKDKVAKESTKSTKLTADSGINSASKWGMKGTEDLGNGYKVGFQYESGIAADTGADTDFDRISTINLYTPYGDLRLGRFGVVTGGTCGGIMTGGVSPFGTSFNSANSQVLFTTENARMNNGIEYKTPVFAGFQATLNYANVEETGIANQDSDFAAIAVTYKNGPVYAGIGYDQIVKSSRLYTAKTAKFDDNGDYKEFDATEEQRKGALDPKTIIAFVQYDLGVAKLYAGYQHNEDKTYAGGSKDGKYLVASFKGVLDSDAYGLGVSAPVCGGTAMGYVGYLDVNGKAKAGAKKPKALSGHAYQVSLGYKYSFSNRTSFYSAASYVQSENDVKSGETGYQKKTIKSVMAGLTHNF